MYFIYTDSTNLQIRCQVPAIVVSHYYGNTFLEITASSAYAAPYNSAGSWDFQNQQSYAFLQSSTKVLMQFTGNIQITDNIVASMGLSAGVFDASMTIGGKVYHRKFVSASGTETLPNPQN